MVSMVSSSSLKSSHKNYSYTHFQNNNKGSSRISYIIFSNQETNIEPNKQLGRRQIILRTSEIAVLGAIFHFSGKKPNYLGVQKNPHALALCPATNNCISTSEDVSDLTHYAPPWSYNPENGRRNKKPVSREEAMNELIYEFPSHSSFFFGNVRGTEMLDVRHSWAHDDLDELQLPLPNYVISTLREPDNIYITVIGSCQAWDFDNKIKSKKPDNFTPRIMEKKDDYIRVEYESPIMFVDGVEFWFPPGKNSTVEYRSSRFENFDSEVNKKRIKALRVELEKKGWASAGTF
ncbi:hypothetical protein MKX01_031367 [Papaver californicum]|nr:hypothetical protein MKX01_031367 [Papaver californicum]